MSQLSLRASIFTSAKCWGWMGRSPELFATYKIWALKGICCHQISQKGYWVSFRNMGAAQKFIILYFCIKRGVNFALFLFFFPFLKNFILFLNFTIVYWFCQISKWIRHRYICVPHHGYTGIKKQRYHFADKGPYSQNNGLSSSHEWMWDLDHKEGWVLKNWCFQTVVLEKTLQSPLDCKEIKPVNPKGNQLWIFIGRTDAEVEAPILWPPDVKSWLIGKDPDAGKDFRQEEKGTAEDEMVGWHHQVNWCESEQTPGDSEGYRSLTCCSSWSCKELDTT